jgi:DNA-binding response OmpR family regulator
VGEGKVGVLILDDESQGQSALRQVLDSEGWRVRSIPDAALVLTELASGEWNLVIANAEMTGVDGPVFQVLKELALSPVEEGARLRVLFIIPDADPALQTEMEEARLPYVLRPFHLHDFLEKVGDLLMEIHVIDAPIRQVQYEFKRQEKRRRKLRKTGRQTSMFASRDDYSMSEEELAEFEKQEKEEAEKRQQPDKKLALGDPH